MSSIVPWVAVGLSDRGRVRVNNEDAFLADCQLPLFAVADGMGGHGAGDVASQLAITCLAQCVETKLQPHLAASGHPAVPTIGAEELTRIVTECVSASNHTIVEQNRIQGNAEGTGMGTTLVGLVLFRQANARTGYATHALIFNVGDSRAYQHTTASPRQLTTDHTLYQEWLQTDQLNPAPPQNIITRALGLYTDIDIDFYTIELGPDSLFWLCSDGVQSMLNEQEIAQITANALADPARKAVALETLSQQLITAANHAGGTDNITVVAVQPLYSK